MRKRLLFCIFLALPLLSVAQSFKVEVPSKVSQDEYFHLRFIVSSDKASDFRPPSLNGFNVLAGPSVSRSTSYQMIGGKTSSSATTTYTYVLSPQAAGTFNIGSASVSVGGTQLHTAPQTVHVGRGSTTQKTQGQGSPPAALQDEIQPAGARITARDLYITATPSRSKVYEQEAILLTYKVHARTGIGLSNVMLSAKPDFTGLIAHEIPIKAIETSPQNIGGATYRTGTILQELIFPSQSGEIKIPPVTFTCTVAQRQGHPTDPLDMFFNSGGTVGVEVQRTAPALTLNVQPLPQPRPQGYTGAVGRFQASLEVPTNEIRAQEPAQLVLKVSGTGNMQMLTPPVLSLPDSLNASTPVQKEDVKVIQDGQTGSITYTYTIVPATSGKLTIPSQHYVFFNPATGKYEEAVTQSITLNVAAAKPGAKHAEASEDDEAEKNDLPWKTVAIILAALLLALAAVAAYIVLRRRRPRKADAYKQLCRSLAELRSSATPQNIAAADQALHDWLSQRLDIPLGKLSRETISDRLAAMSFPNSDTDVLLSALDEFAAVGYAAGSGPGLDQAKLDALRGSIDKIEKIEN